MFKNLAALLLLTACAMTAQKAPVLTPPAAETAAAPAKEFSWGEIILATELLTRIFDQQMAPLECVPDTDEAQLLLRTVRPRMEIVMDDMEAMLDDPKEVDQLVKTCDQNCTCGYVDELLREHLVNLTKSQRKTITAKKSDKEIARCMNYVQTTFCQSDLYKTLNKEKADFSFEEGP
jgi:hypothetical protein